MQRQRIEMKVILKDLNFGLYGIQYQSQMSRRRKTGTRTKQYLLITFTDRKKLKIILFDTKKTLL